MNDEGRLPSAKDGLQTFLKEVAPQDRVGLTIFNDRVTEVAPITPVREIRASLRGRRLAAHRRRRHGDLRRDRRTASRQVKKLADTSRINAVVLLTDGEDTDSSKSVDVGRARARRAGRLVAPRARVHDRLLGRRGGRRGEARADRARRRAARPTRATPTTSNRSTAASARSSRRRSVSSPARQPYSRGEFAGRARRQRDGQAVQHRAADRDDGRGRARRRQRGAWRCSSRSSVYAIAVRARRSSTRRRPTPCSRACAPSAARR